MEEENMSELEKEALDEEERQKEKEHESHHRRY